MCLAIPGRIVEVFLENDMRMGKIDFSGISKRVCLEHVPDAHPGDYVTVHVGFALQKIDPIEAERIFTLLSELSDLSDLGTPDL